ncbi:MAG: helix-turn-helix domain-containing protein [Acholeplasmatales bacterium]|nr:helix-turn-helix domain-containing protein [Acholeplasmatales bacterium]
MNDLKKTIANNLIELRKRKKYTQQDLGNILGYSDKAISKWEKGDSLPDIEVLYQICNLYGVTLDYLTHEGSYDEKKEYIMPKYERRNKIFITLLFSTLVWFVVILVFVYYQNKDIDFWPVFLWGIPATCAMLFYFNIKWGRRVFNVPILSVLDWGLLLSIFCTLLYMNNNFWPIFLIGIPFQVAVILWAQIKHE